MSSSEKIAIAAHMHVLLRRKTGRVTDTEWMASNREYAQEVVRLAREKATEEDHAELGVWADKLESIMAPVAPKASRPQVWQVPDTEKEVAARSLGAEAAASANPGGDSMFGDSELGSDGTQRPNAPRYVKGLR